MQRETGGVGRAPLRELSVRDDKVAWRPQRARASAAADGLVYDLITTDHRIRIVADDGAELECADYLELPEGRAAYDRLLGRLNAGLAVA